MPHIIFRVGLDIINYWKGKSYKIVEGGQGGGEVLSQQKWGRTCCDITLMQSTESGGERKGFHP